MFFNVFQNVVFSEILFFPPPRRVLSTVVVL